MTDTAFLAGISLLGIHMHSCKHERGAGDLEGDPTIETQGQLQPLRADDSRLGYLVTLGYRVLNGMGDPVATGEVAYAATYELADGLSLTDQQVELFGHQGVLFQVHPFLREHMATMCQRSGLAPYPLPILLHDLAQEAVDESESIDGM